MFNVQALLDKRQKLKQEIKSIDIEVRQEAREWLSFDAAQMRNYIEPLQSFHIYDSKLKLVRSVWFRTSKSLGVDTFDTLDLNYMKKHVKHWMPFPAPPEKT